MAKEGAFLAISLLVLWLCDDTTRSTYAQETWEFSGNCAVLGDGYFCDHDVNYDKYDSSTEEEIIFIGDVLVHCLDSQQHTFTPCNMGCVTSSNNSYCQCDLSIGAETCEEPDGWICQNDGRCICSFGDYQCPPNFCTFLTNGNYCSADTLILCRDRLIHDSFDCASSCADGSGCTCPDNSCSGNGVCNVYGNCECDTGWFGEECDQRAAWYVVPIIFGSIICCAIGIVGFALIFCFRLRSEFDRRIHDVKEEGDWPDSGIELQNVQESAVHSHHSFSNCTTEEEEEDTEKERDEGGGKKEKEQESSGGETEITVEEGPTTLGKMNDNIKKSRGEDQLEDIDIEMMEALPELHNLDVSEDSDNDPYAD